MGLTVPVAHTKRPLRRHGAFRRTVLLALVPWSLAAGAQQSLSLGSALKAVLEDNTDVRIATVQIDSASAAAVAARGIFDPMLSASVQRFDENRPLTASEILLNPLVSSEYSRSSLVDLGLERLTRSGIAVSGSASMEYAQDRVSESLGVPSQTIGRLTFGVLLPIARGAGERVVGAGIRAADLEVDAATAQRRFAISRSLRDTAIAFWNYRGAWEQLKIARAGERRARQLIDEQRKLVAADQIPASDLALSSANLTERVDARIGAEQSMVTARQALGLLMGIPSGRLATIPPPADEFSQVGAAPPDPSQVPKLVREAIETRDDLKAQALLLRAAHERVLTARDQAKPQVNLRVTVGATAGREAAPLATYADPFALSGAGPSIAVELSAQLPYGNHAAQGEIGQAMAAVTTLEIQLRALRTQIASRVMTSVDELQHAQQQLAASRDLVDRYTEALKYERVKRRLGVATLVDVISVEDRLQSAQLADVDRRRAYAESIVRLKYELGALLARGGQRFEIRERDFLRFRPR